MPARIPRSGSQRVCVAGAALVLVGVLPAGAAGDPVLVYETSLQAVPPLTRPISLSLAPDTGELCVTDDGARTIDVFDDTGHHRYRSDAVSSLSTPRDATIDSRAGFVLTDSEKSVRTIRRLNFLGEPVPYEAEIPLDGWNPRHLLVASDGNYVTLDRAGLLAKHDADDGTLLWSRPLTERGSERSDLIGRPAEAPDGSIYLASGLDGTVMVFGPDGERRTSFGVKGSHTGEFTLPVAVAFAADGRVLVLDRMKHKILIFDAEHRFLAEWGSVGYAPGTFYSPVALVVAPDGRVFVAQGFEGRVQVFRLADAASE